MSKWSSKGKGLIERVITLSGLCFVFSGRKIATYKENVNRPLAHPHPALHPPRHARTHTHTHTPFHPPTHPSTHPPILPPTHPSTHPSIHPGTHARTHPPTQHSFSFVALLQRKHRLQPMHPCFLLFLNQIITASPHL